MTSVLANVLLLLLNLLKMENARGGNRHGLSAVFFEKIAA